MKYNLWHNSRRNSTHLCPEPNQRGVEPATLRVTAIKFARSTGFILLVVATNSTLYVTIGESRHNIVTEPKQQMELYIATSEKLHKE